MKNKVVKVILWSVLIIFILFCVFIGSLVVKDLKQEDDLGDNIKEINDMFSQDDLDVDKINKSLKSYVTTDNKNGYLKRLLTKEEIEKLIDNIPNIMPVEADSHLLDNIYKELFHSGNHEDLIKIIKTTYLRNKHRKEAKRSIGQKDDEYFKKAERYLYNEFSVVLGLDFDETKKYVIDKVKENVKD